MQLEIRRDKSNFWLSAELGCATQNICNVDNILTGGVEICIWQVCEYRGEIFST